MKPSELVMLVKKVFGTESGEQLLKELDISVSNKLYSKNPYKVYFRIGQTDFVRNLAALSKMSTSEVNELKKQEKAVSEDTDLLNSMERGLWDKSLTMIGE